MASATVEVVYAYTLLEIALDLGAVYYAYRLTNITGAFTGWVLMVGAVLLITLQNTYSILTLALSFPESQLESLVSGPRTDAIVPGAIIGVAISITLFGAMFELYRTFSRVQAKEAA